MLNALMPGTDVPIHRHTQSNETVFFSAEKSLKSYMMIQGMKRNGFILIQSWETSAVLFLLVSGIRLMYWNLR